VRKAEDGFAQDLQTVFSVANPLFCGPSHQALGWLLVPIGAQPETNSQIPPLTLILLRTAAAAKLVPAARASAVPILAPCPAAEPPGIPFRAAGRRERACSRLCGERASKTLK
jgi:hypothetical protein